MENEEKHNKIIIADDDDDIRTVLTDLLQNEGYEITAAANGDEALRLAKDNPKTDLMILDIMMPELDGMQVCNLLREFSNMPVLFLTARTSAKDKSDAYQNGGDDFLCKPFSANELKMKVSSMIRRYRVYNTSTGLANRKGTISVGSAEIDLQKHVVYVDSVEIFFTGKEYDIFTLLSLNRGKVYSPEDIYSMVWHEKFLPSSANTIMVHILNIRRKLSACCGESIIKTVWGKGYTVE